MGSVCRRTSQLASPPGHQRRQRVPTAALYRNDEALAEGSDSSCAYGDDVNEWEVRGERDLANYSFANFDLSQFEMIYSREN